MTHRRNTRILNVRIPTELHDALTERARQGNESLAWATRYTLRVGLRGPAPAQMSIVDEMPPPDPQRSAGGSRKGRKSPARKAARKGGK